MPQWSGARNEQELKEVLLRDERFLSLQSQPEKRGGWLIGHSLGDLHLPHGCLVALIRRNDDLIVPSGDTVLEDKDWIAIIGKPRKIQKLRETFLASPPASTASHGSSRTIRRSVSTLRKRLIRRSRLS